jgi:hypothetical protein
MTCYTSHWELYFVLVCQVTFYVECYYYLMLRYFNGVAVGTPNKSPLVS